MTLLKRFTAWDIGLNQWTKRRHPRRIHPTQQLFRTFSLQLLLSYLGAMTVVMGLSAMAVYQVFYTSLLQELDVHLVTIAEAAKHNLSAVPSGGGDRKQPAIIDQDADLDLPWQDLQKTTDTVEWFDARGKRLSVAGRKIPLKAFTPQLQPVQQGNLRALTLPVAAQGQTPQGYVRVSMDTHEVEEDLDRLRLGLGIGGAVAIALMGVTGGVLTRRSLRPIERSMEKLQQFTADASHELRSPITAIKTAVAVMQTHPERVHTADVRKLKMMAQATAHMTDLMEDLLLLARADDDALRGADRTHPVPLHNLLEDLVELLLPKVEAAGLQLQMDPLTPLWAEGNGSQLSRVFLNLLENAILYTPRGGSIALALTQANSTALIALRDTGIGIDAAHLPHIFDRFWRADPSRSRQTGGTGLGLAIAQAIVTAHHGKLTVTSQLGVGSCFQVELPSLNEMPEYIS
jgi:signal transduction histidine kinase